MMNNNEVLIALGNKEKNFVCSSGDKPIFDFNTLSAIYYTNTDNISIKKTMLEDYLIIEDIHNTILLQLRVNDSPLNKFSLFNENVYLFLYNEEIFCVANSTNNSKITITNLAQTKKKEIPFSGDAFLYCKERNLIVIKTKTTVVILSLLNIFDNANVITKEFPLYDNNTISHNTCNNVKITERFILLFYTHNWSCVAYIIDLELAQCLTCFHLENKKNTLILFDKNSGVPYFDDSNINLNNKVLILLNSISSQCEIYDIKYYTILKQLLNDPATMEIRQIVPNKYWFIISNYYYIYDVEKESYVQKISNLMPNSFVITEKYFIYHSGKGIYKLNININNNFIEKNNV